MLAAVADGGVEQRRPRVARHCDKAAEIRHRGERRIGRQNELVRHQARHRQQILERIDRHLGVEVRIDCEQRARAQQQRIAVGRCMRGEFAGQVTVRARPVLHHDRLTQARAQWLAECAGNEIGRASRGKRHQQPDRPSGKRLRRRGARKHREDGRKREADKGGQDDLHDAVFRGSQVGPSFCRMRARADNQSRIFPGLSLVRRASHNGIHRVPKRIIAHGPFPLRRVEEVMSEKIYDVPPEWKKRAYVDADKYKEMYARSLKDPNSFWAEEAKRLHWYKAPTKIKNSSFGPGNVSIKWFEDGVLNAAYNCIDRHLAKRAKQTAIIWEGDDPSQSKHITYRELHDEVCRFANILRNRNVEKGDRVTIYLPMIPEIAYAVLACARIGAIHSVVFGGFSPDSLAGRIADCKSNVVITADEGVRGGRKVPLKTNADAAIAKVGGVDHVIVVRRTGAAVDMEPGRDVWYHEAAKVVTSECPCEHMNAEDPLFILYTSGSTGQPKGVLHTTGGYLVYTAMTHEYIFDYREGEVYWCTADVGWVTGHSYIVYGPLANGATTLMFEGVPNYPDPSRFWQVVDKHDVRIFYTAPMAIRALMREGEDYVRRTSRRSLRILGTVGEPINPEAWLWYYDHVGEQRCPVVDTWWQTETGGILITPIPGATPLKPGSATRPFFGVEPVIVDNDGKRVDGPGEGNLCLARPWPGMMRTVFGDHPRFVATYFSAFPGLYFTGDGARRDEDGFYWLTGRVDDVINVAGHRLGTAEIESALVAHPKVAEAAVVGYPHDLKGQGIYAYVTLRATENPSEELRRELVTWVRQEISPIASPDLLQWAPGLPKTRSGKIMRRILRKIAANEHDALGDVTTLADPSVVDELVENRMNRA